jgi:hypothetical protein
MAHRPPGRPKAVEPRLYQAGIRFTEKEADQLCRLAKEGTLSAAVRKAVSHYITHMGGAQKLPDTDKARSHREWRKIKRRTTPEGAAQVAAEEEAEIDKLQHQYDQPAVRVVTVPVEKVPDPYAGKVVHIDVRKVSGDEAP